MNLRKVTINALKGLRFGRLTPRILPDSAPIILKPKRKRHYQSLNTGPRHSRQGHRS